MATQPTIKTRILILSDTHCASLSHSTPGSGFKRPLPKADLAIHCGDLTYTGKADEYVKALDLLKEIDAPVKLVIAGNHERTLDRDYLLGHLNTYGPVPERAEELFSNARELWTSTDGRARKEGVTFLDEGTHTIPLPNGASAKVYASAYTPEFCDWAFPYERDEDRFNPPEASLKDAKNIASNPVSSFEGVERPLDLMITHGPPYGRLDQTGRGSLVGCPHLLRAVMRARPKVHCFGHIHEGRGAERVKWSRRADAVATKEESIDQWKRDSQKGVESAKAEREEWGFEAEDVGNAAFVNGNGLKRGEETIFVNASIMDVRYRPWNAPWLIDVELPATSTKS